MNSEDLRQKEMEYARSVSQSMLQWEKEKQTLLPIILKRKGLDMIASNIPAIVQATGFDQMCSPENAPYCSLYLKGEKCHKHLEDLNCGLCNCPNYDASSITEEPERVLIGKCSISSKRGHYHFSQSYPRVGVWSCEECPVHHSEKFIKRHLEKTLPKSI